VSSSYVAVSGKRSPELGKFIFVLVIKGIAGLAAAASIYVESLFFSLNQRKDGLPALIMA